MVRAVSLLRRKEERRLSSEHASQYLELVENVVVGRTCDVAGCAGAIRAIAPSNPLPRQGRARKGRAAGGPR
jgi:hypothetical protein